jgi:DNA (cytosine-5)-methyltransferase 1
MSAPLPTSELSSGVAGHSFAASNCSPSRFHLDLFSGIGGFALAARWTGWQTIGFSEIEPYACKILKRHWPDVPNYGDIRNIRGVRCDLISGGFPCQPYSVAGKRGGASDDRALWPEMLRVIEESKPRWVLGENVPGIITLELDRVLSDLENIGYSAWPLVLPACALDARHRRDRVWIVANDAKRGWSGLESPNSGSGDSERRAQGTAGGCRCSLADAERLRRRESSAHPDEAQEPLDTTERKESASRSRPSGEAVSDDGCRCGERARREVCGTTQPARWQPEPDVGRVVDGIPARMDRLRGLGNAIVPQVAAALMRQMAWMENSD